ncbi:MAG: transposase [Beijerinckiaceae bacterium]
MTAPLHPVPMPMPTQGYVGQRARELLREITRSHERAIHAGAINRDHVHMLLSVPPRLSVSRAVQFLKGKARISCFRNISLCASATGASIYGRGATGWRRATTSPMRCG